METLQTLIGKNLKTIRQKQNLSLDEASACTGISKAMLGQIERGKTNPTVSTLWKIASGLKVPFSAFMKPQISDYTLVSQEQIDPILECDGKMKIYPLFPFDAGNHFEILHIHLLPGCEHQSSPHNQGVEEYITVIDGELQMTVADQVIYIKKGQALKFIATVPHAYSNLTTETCLFQNLILYQP